MNLNQFYSNCRLCPHQCKINRIKGRQTAKYGICGETNRLRVAYVGPHFGEEPPISGINGSGTVFLSGCSLRCSFCQNYQISHQGMGAFMDIEALLQKLGETVKLYRIHNINFVTPDHFFPHIFQLVSLLRKKHLDLPVVFNTSGYQSVKTLKYAEDYANIYIPDFKYSDIALATRLSRCPNYPQVALKAISEMIRQKGFLDACLTDEKIAKKGVLVRHLILPGHVNNSINALTSLFLEFGSKLPLSLMSQYHPVHHHKDHNLNRCLSEKEFNKVYFHSQELGFEYLFVQFPERNSDNPPATSPYLPDFTLARPFR